MVAFCRFLLVYYLTVKIELGAEIKAGSGVNSQEKNQKVRIIESMLLINALVGLLVSSLSPRLINRGFQCKWK